jgi:hypothetical protein
MLHKQAYISHGSIILLTSIHVSLQIRQTYWCLWWRHLARIINGRQEQATHEQTQEALNDCNYDTSCTLITFPVWDLQHTKHFIFVANSVQFVFWGSNISLQIRAFIGKRINWRLKGLIASLSGKAESSTPYRKRYRDGIRTWHLQTPSQFVTINKPPQKLNL